MSFLAPLFFAGLAAVAVPIFVHLIQRERKDIVDFPSLMFLQRIPYQSVERRRIHNWWLLALRTAAMALVVLAFARPFLKQDPVRAAAAASGSREVVILLDRSASMGYGTHWTRAQDEARRIAGGIHGDDRATLVLFDRGVEEAVRATSNAGELQAAIRQATVSSGSTRYAPALREAQSLLGRSDRARKEVYLISDFQKTGWERQEDIRLPEGATITPISVADMETADLAVASVVLKRASFSGEERVTISAGLINRSGAPVTNQAVRLEIDGREVAERAISLSPNASGSVTFDPLTVAEANVRGAIRAGSDALAADNSFYFVLSPSRPVSVLILQAADAGASQSLYLTTALDLSKAPPFTVDVASASRLTPGQFDGRSVVVLNDASPLSAASLDALRRFVERGGGLFIILGARSPLPAVSPLLPGAIGNPIDRMSFRGGTLGYLNYSHPIFDSFKEPREASFANMRFLRYRSLVPGPDDHVLARYDDGATAMVERRVGSGRVIAFTSTMNDDWNDYPKHGMFVPVVHEVVKYLAQYSEPEAWHTVGRMLDISAPIAAIVREGQAASTAGAAQGSAAVVVAPSGRQVTLGGRGATSLELAEQGIYSVRLPGQGDRRPFVAAVNLDPAESDLAALSPVDFLASATGRDAVAPSGEAFDRVQLTPQDLERRQSIWWYLLVIGLAVLLGESVLSNRLSRAGAARRAAMAEGQA
jgi:hypothetical protein